MLQEFPRSTVATVERPVYSTFSPFPFGFFAAALLTDVAYWRTAEMQWANFSVWLITVGLVMSGLAVLAGVFDLVTKNRAHGASPAWLPAIGNLVAVALALVNAFVHSRDAYTSVVPTGLALSGLVVLILLATSAAGSAVIVRSHAEVVR